jgi:hypothetical protein
MIKIIGTALLLGLVALAGVGIGAAIFVAVEVIMEDADYS